MVWLYVPDEPYSGNADVLTGLSACAGYGGLDLALNLIFGDRYRTVCYVEREAHAAASLVARMEDEAMDRAPVWDCVETFPGRTFNGALDILSAGYPCQPFSSSGKRKGQEDPRHIWPHLSRIVDEGEPEWVWLENVPGHLTLGYRDVRAELEAKGYRVEEGLFTAHEVGASQIRKRLFVLAHAESVADPGRRRRFEGAGLCRERSPRSRWREPHYGCEPLANTCGTGLQGCEQSGSLHGNRHGEKAHGPAPELRYARLPAFPPGPSDLEAWREVLKIDPLLEPAIRGVVDGPAYRVDRLQLCGNGVVPLEAAYAFLTLLKDFV